jgi:hypothetical protein
MATIVLCASGLSRYPNAPGLPTSNDCVRWIDKGIVGSATLIVEQLALEI